MKGFAGREKIFSGDRGHALWDWISRPWESMVFLGKIPDEALNPSRRIQGHETTSSSSPGIRSQIMHLCAAPCFLLPGWLLSDPLKLSNTQNQH
jgi:hypothetical protein